MIQTQSKIVVRSVKEGGRYVFRDNPFKEIKIKTYGTLIKF